MLEVSRVGEAESDDEIELSLELSIGGRYGKCEKPRQQQMIEEPSSLSRENNEPVAVENGVIPRAGFTFSDASVIGGEFQVEGGNVESATGSVIAETVEQNRKREIQALRRLEARRKREERMRKSGVGFRGILPINGNVNYNFDKVGLEAQQLQERAQDRKNREEECFLYDDDMVIKNKETHKAKNFALKNGEIAYQNHGNMQFRGLQQQPKCAPLKNGFLCHPYGPPPGSVAGGVRKEENEVFQPGACGSFRPYVNGNGNNLDIVRQNSEISGHDSSVQNQSGFISKIVNQNAVSNGSLEGSSSAISDYRSTSGKGGSTTDTGSQSSCLQANDRQMSITATSDAVNQAEVDATMLVPKNTILSRESDCGADNNIAPVCKVYSKPAVLTSKPANPTSSLPKQSGNSSDDPSNHHQPQQNGDNLTPTLPQMPCVSTTGNGPNGKTITGFLYRYTKNEVTIVCVCHGSSFSPAEFVEHAGGTDVTNPLRHITMASSPFV